MRNPLRVYLDRRCINIAELARRADIPKTTIYSVSADALLRPTPFDKPDTVEDQITWLRKTGFTDVECAYRMLRFASIVARKPLRRA